MKFLKKFNELFFIDRPVNYPMAVDAGQIKPYQLGDNMVILSDIEKRYYDYFELKKLQLDWNQYCLENNIDNNIKTIKTSKELDYILKYIRE